MKERVSHQPAQKLIIKKCHICGQITESSVEQDKCVSCGKSFLPLNYFAKIHDHGSTQFENLFSESSDLCEDELVKGIYVLW